MEVIARVAGCVRRSLVEPLKPLVAYAPKEAGASSRPLWAKPEDQQGSFLMWEV